MKLLSLQINNAFECVLDFGKTAEVNPSYIIDGKTGSVELFKLPIDRRSRMASSMFPLLFLQTDEQETHASLYKLVESEETPGKTDLKFRLDFYLYAVLGESRNREIRKQEAELRREGDPDSLYFPEDYVRRSFTDDKTYELEVTFHLLLLPDREELVKSFTLFISPNKWVEVVALDFGSEASQLLVYNRDLDQVHLSNILEVFNMTKEALLPSDTSPASDFVQYDKNPGLFRSHFLTRKEFSGSTADPACDPSDDNLKVLFKRTELASLNADYVSLPNVKIAETGAANPKVEYMGKDEDVIDFKDRYYYRRTINSFLYRALEQVEHVSKNKGHRMLVRLVVLMPNIYGQKRLSEHLRYIERDLNQIVRTSYDDSVIGVEINSVSESDASLLGAAFTDGYLGWNKGRYLIMDAGRGTLDFSVLENNPDIQGASQFRCICRSGIVGAGNALTYALFLDILKDAITPYLAGTDPEAAMSVIISKIVYGGDEAHLNELLTCVELYKQCISGALVDKSSMPSWSSGSARGGKSGWKDIDLQTLKDLFKDYVDEAKPCAARLDKGTPYLDKMVKKLAENVLTEIRYRGPVDRVVLAGRGFLYKPFQEAITEAIHRVENWKDAEVCLFESKRDQSYTIKNVCLFASELIALGHHYGKRVGRPFMFEMGAYLYENSEQRKDASNLPGFWKGLLKLKRKAENGIFGDFEPGDETKEMEYADYIHGRQLKVRSRNSCVWISGRLHYFDSSVRPGHIDILFDGEEFLCRQRNALYHWGPGPAKPFNFYTESTFPYAKPSSIPFPL